jgi:hypothetical protein
MPFQRAGALADVRGQAFHQLQSVLTRNLEERSRNVTTTQKNYANEAPMWKKVLGAAVGGMLGGVLGPIGGAIGGKVAGALGGGGGDRTAGIMSGLKEIGGGASGMMEAYQGMQSTSTFPRGGGGGGNIYSANPYPSRSPF